MAGPFRILILEDNEDWLALLQGNCSKMAGIGNVSTAHDQRQATELLGQNHFHFVSIDQNIPDVFGESVGANYGLDFCARLVRERPLTARSIYTANGKTSYANRVGSLDGTPYVEKRSSEKPPEPDVEYLDVPEYAVWIARRLNDQHHFWALERCKSVLPPSLGEPAHELGRTWDQGDWARALDQLGILWERSLELAWAQARAIAVSLGVPLPQSILNANSFAPRGKEDDLGRLWPAIAAQGGLAQWRKYVGVGNRDNGQGTGRNFVDLSGRLRAIRNSRAHGDIAHPSEHDIASRLDDIRSLIDALAFWGEVPLLTAPRYHPSERGKIQYIRLAGPPPWPVADFQIEVTLPNNRSDRVYVLWRTEKSTDLVDLFPFVVMDRGEAGRLEPHVLVSPIGSRPRYRSLVSGRTTDDRPDWQPSRNLIVALADHFGAGRPQK